MYKVTWGNVEIIDNNTGTKFGFVKRRRKSEPCRQSFIHASMEMFALIYISLSCTPFTNIEREYEDENALSRNRYNVEFR